jgi:hypothetical protein
MIEQINGTHKLTSTTDFKLDMNDSNAVFHAFVAFAKSHNSDSRQYYHHLQTYSGIRGMNLQILQWRMVLFVKV